MYRLIQNDWITFLAHVCGIKIDAPSEASHIYFEEDTEDEQEEESIADDDEQLNTASLPSWDTQWNVNVAACRFYGQSVGFSAQKTCIPYKKYWNKTSTF